MALLFDPPPNEGALRQGELLANVYINRPVAPAAAVRHEVDVAFEEHPLVVVMTSDCDLLHDFEARKPLAALPRSPGDRRLVPQVLVCDVYTADQMRPRFAGRDIWRRAEQNQDERYHSFKSAPIGAGPDSIPDIYLDFKLVFGVFTQGLYDAIDHGAIVRKAVIPPIYLHDLTHRFYGFLSRVALPE